MRARKLRKFVEILEQESAALLDGHLRRHDFSKWISTVFGDHALALDVRRIEEDHRDGRSNGAVASLARAVRDRYEFLDPIPGSEER